MFLKRIWTNSFVVACLSLARDFNVVGDPVTTIARESDKSRTGIGQSVAIRTRSLYNIKETTVEPPTIIVEKCVAD